MSKNKYLAEFEIAMIRWGFASERKRMYQILGRAARDGRPMLDVVKSICDFLPPRHPMRKALQLVLQRLRAGGTSRKGIATIGSEFKDLIPEDERMLICAGESSARAHEGYMGAYSLVEWREKTKKEFMNAMATPLLLLVAVFGLLYVISTQVMPEFSKMFTIMPPDLQTLDWVSKNYFSIVGVFFGFFLAFFFSYQYMVKTVVGRIRENLDVTLFRFSTQLACAFFMQNISNFMASGVSIVDAILKMSETDNKYLKYQYGLILRHIRKGIPFEETLMKVSIVPKKYHWVLAAYGMMSDKEKMYASIAAEVKENLTETIKRIATFVNLIVLVMFAGILGYTYFTLMNSAMSLSRTAM